jgi:adenylate cyclase
VGGAGSPRAPADVFAVQDDIADNVARALRQKLSAARPLLRIDPAAYELYLRARALTTEVGMEARRDAARLLEEVVSREPRFAKGWAMLAAARTFLLPPARDSIGEPEHAAALNAANRALALDPKCAEGYRALAMLKPAFGEYAEKVRLIETALALSPNDPIILGSAGIALLSVGRSHGADEVTARAASAEPLSPFHMALHAGALRRIGRRDEAMAFLESAWRRYPDSVGLWLTRWDLLIHDGRLDEAERMCAPGTMPNDVSRYAMPMLQLTHAVLRADHGARRPLLEAALQVDKRTTFSLATAAFAAFAGHSDLAFERSFAALDLGAPISAFWSESMIARAYTTSLLFHFRNETMRRDPRFALVCARLGLVDYWRESGKWPDCADETPYDFRRACEDATARKA